MSFSTPSDLAQQTPSTSEQTTQVVAIEVGYRNHPFHQLGDMIMGNGEAPKHNQIVLIGRLDGTVKAGWVHEAFTKDRHPGDAWWATFTDEPDVCCADCEEGLRGGTSRGC
jgi:hypothetical protein